jgi:hypothetical protein
MHQREQLEPVVEAGHASIHRGYKPTEGDIHALLDIIENIVEALYVSPQQANSVKRRVPPTSPNSGGGVLLAPGENQQ